MNQKKENEFLTNYHLENYDRPSVAADIVAFTIKNKETDDYRKLSKKELSVLMIKRNEYPFKDYWALPGGFARKDETLEDTAIRELNEEAGVSDIALMQLQTFSDIRRDPRGWIISCAYLALAEEEQFHITAGSDAAAAEWFQIKYDLIQEKSEEIMQGKCKVKRFELQLMHSDIKLEANIDIKTYFTAKKQRTEYEITNIQGIAFDHAKIIGFAMEYLRENLNGSKLAFELLPKYFTLTDLQQVYEAILDEELLPANFRRKISDFVIETDEITKGAGHRPSKLFKRNIEQFN
ncbi:NUDIX domain-containing protein [Lachnotalea glycerini]|uniref:NUDIX domain-containing protein n=1 Tax=Lachnotalea glycerini TaxID=1763509 RepID=A0A318ESR9_9FIRM|nr:NUDIX domain-containing protein [Lachnotalea glycerini]PXV95560.1 NUDIX domain-containing protein [Lachnotalea glycerini]